MAAKPRCAYCKRIVSEADRNSDGSYACDKCLRERMTKPYPRMERK